MRDWRVYDGEADAADRLRACLERGGAGEGAASDEQDSARRQRAAACIVGAERADLAAELPASQLLADAGREMGNPASQLSLPAIAPRSARDRDTIGLACKIAFSDPAAWDKPTPAVSPITSERAFVTAPFLKMLYWRTAAVISAMVCAGVASALLQLPNQWHSKTLAAASPATLSPRGSGSSKRTANGGFTNAHKAC